MTISFLRNRSIPGIGAGGHAATAKHRRLEIKPGTNSPPSMLRGLQRWENGLRKVLPQPLTDSLFRRLAPLPPANGSPADAARLPFSEARVARESVEP